MSHVDPEQLAGLALDPADGPADVREHAETCPECAGLVAAFTGVRRRAGADALVPPPAALRAQVLAEVRSGDAEPQLQPRSAPAGPARRRGVPLWLAGVAAALALLAGIGLGRIGTSGDDTPEAGEPPTGAGTVVAAAPLTALDSDAARGEAEAVQTDETFTIRVSASELGDEPG